MRGSYILLIFVKKNFEEKIGKLGKVKFKKGFYAYVGSAFGRTVNLENRIARHLRKNKKKFWHIDYLLSSQNVKIKKVYVFPSRKIECYLAKNLLKFSEGFIKNFGSSDCKCISHLLYFKSFRNLSEILSKVIRKKRNFVYCDISFHLKTKNPSISFQKCANENR